MRQQRVDFGNPGGERHEGGADGTARTDGIPVFLGKSDEFLGGDIHQREVVLDDGIQFFVQALVDISGQRVTVYRFRALLADVNEGLFRALQFRRIGFGF